MTDEELVKALRLLAFVHNDGAITQAADRIEQLERQLNDLLRAARDVLHDLYHGNGLEGLYMRRDRLADTIEKITGGGT
jgi:IS5 family transposase